MEHVGGFEGSCRTGQPHAARIDHFLDIAQRVPTSSSAMEGELIPISQKSFLEALTQLVV